MAERVKSRGMRNDLRDVCNLTISRQQPRTDYNEI